MMHKCVDNLEKFYFRDSQLHECKFQNGIMTWLVSGLVARYNNPSNETLVDRYMETTQIRFLDAKIKQMFLEGAKLYSADDKLLEEIPDTMIDEAEYENTMKLFEDGIVFWVKERESGIEGRLCLEMGIDVKDEETEETDTYWMELEYEKAIFEWEHFLNKAMLE